MSHICLTIVVLIATLCILAKSQRSTYWCTWSRCSSTCQGTQTRRCACPKPATKNEPQCLPGLIQRRDCGCNPVHGGWSAYGPWGVCSVTCGGGYQTRTRTCTNPSPACCGHDCVGSRVERRKCSTQACPIVSVDQAQFVEALIRVDHTDTTRCHARPSICLPGAPCHDKCVDFCFYHDRDFLIILDSSGSISQAAFAEAKVDLAILATHLCGHIGCNLRVAAMQFSTNPHYEFGFDSHNTPAALYSGIVGIGKEGGGTRTHLAFDFARLTMFTTMNGHRPCAKKVALIVTDGRSSNGALAITAAQNLKNSGVELFAVFIGNAASADYAEIRDYVSDPESLHVFSVASVAELGVLADYIESFHHKFCHCHCHCHCQHHCGCDNHCHRLTVSTNPNP